MVNDWAVEVGGLEPDVIRTDQDAPVFIPSANSLPKVRLPVRPLPDDLGNWSDAQFDEASMTVNGPDGDELGIDRLEAVEEKPGYRVLVGVGGVELEAQVEPADTEYLSEPVVDVVSSLVESKTSYIANAGIIDGSTTTQTVQSASTSSEFSARLLTDPAGEPFRVNSDTVELLQSAESSASGAVSAVGDTVSTTFTPQYDLPAYAGPDTGGALAVRYSSGTATAPAFDLRINGFRVASSPAGRDLSTAGYDTGLGVPFALEAGRTYRIDAVVTQATGDSVTLRPALYDSRFNYTFDADGPQDYPDAVDVVFDDAEIFDAVPAASLSSSWNDTSTNQAVAISNTRGRSFVTASNTTSVSASFTDGSGNTDYGPSVRFRATLSRYGSSGNQGQVLQSFSLDADLADVPLVVDQSFDGQLISVLRRLTEASQGNYIFEVRYNADSDPANYSVEWTRSGERSSARDPRIRDFRTERQGGGRVEQAVVRGSAQQVRDERVDHGGGTLTLARDNVVIGSERVLPEGATDPLRRGQDYEVDYAAGEISGLDTDVYLIDYRWTPVGSSGSGRAETFRVPEVDTERGARFAARELQEAGSTPWYSATARLPAADADFSVVETLSSDVFPDALLVKAVQASADGTELQFASRQGIKGIVDDLGDRLDALADRV